MKNVLLYLLTGMLVGTIYALAKVRSPMPSMLVLISFLGMFLGEQLPGMIQQCRRGELPLLRHAAPVSEPARTSSDNAPTVPLFSS